jgi:hypothetical protein
MPVLPVLAVARLRASIGVSHEISVSCVSVLSPLAMPLLRKIPG